MKKMIRYFLLTTNINRIDLCVASIEMHIYYHFVFHIGQKHLNALRSILYLEKSAIGQLITLNNSMMI